MKGKPRGYAFVEYAAREDAAQALVALHDKTIRGRNIVVTFAQQSPLIDGGSITDRPGGRKGVDAARPTTLSLLKTSSRPNSTSGKIAALEAKLKQMQASTDGPLSPAAATASGVLPPRPTGSNAGS